MFKKEFETGDVVDITKNAHISYLIAKDWYVKAMKKLDTQVKFNNITNACILVLAITISYCLDNNEIVSEQELKSQVSAVLIPEDYSQFNIFFYQMNPDNEEISRLWKEFQLVNAWDTERGYSLAFAVLELLRFAF